MLELQLQTKNCPTHNTFYNGNKFHLSQKEQKYSAKKIAVVFVSQKRN